MKLPKMILFDYEQTLIAKDAFQPIKGNQALLQIAVKKPKGITAEQVQQTANELSKEIRIAFGVENRNEHKLEFSSCAFNRYLYEFLGIEFA